MDVFNKIKQLLDQAGIQYQVMDHERVHTCEDAAKIRGTSPDQGAKALVCVADGQPILIVLPCSTKLDVKEFKRWQRIKDLRFATPEEVTKITGIEVGAIPPIGKALGLTTYVEEQLLKEKQICFNAGVHTRSMIMKSKDYLQIVKPEVGSFTNNK